MCPFVTADFTAQYFLSCVYTVSWINKKSASFLLLPYKILLYGHTTFSMSIHPNDRHLRYSQSLATGGNTSRTICIKILMRIFLLSLIIIVQQNCWFLQQYDGCGAHVRNMWLHSDHDTSHFYQQSIVLRFLHMLNNASYHVLFTIMSILVSMNPCVIVVLICIFLISGAGKLLFLTLVSYSVLGISFLRAVYSN